MRKAALIALGLAALVIATVLIGLRVESVTAEAISIPEERYAIGDEVPLGGAFMSQSSEGTEHYSVQMLDVKRMSYNDYMRAYGIEGAQIVEGYDAQSIIDVEMKITNSGDDLGGLNMWEFILVPETGNTYCIPNIQLWELSEAQLPPETSPITLRPHSTYTTHVPFAVNWTANEDERFRNDIPGTDFTLHVADAPVSKVICLGL